MKKTTIRIVGFLFAATCVALLASCNQPNGSTNNSTTPAAFDKTQLKNSLWMLKNSGLGSTAYLFHFDDGVVLRLAYGDKLEKDEIKTRTDKVECKIKDDKVTIDELRIKEAKIKMKDKALTITVSPTKTITLEKVGNEDIQKLKFNENNGENTVVELFNKVLLNIPPVFFDNPKGTSFKIIALNSKYPGNKTDGKPKVYHVAFIEDEKLIFTVDQIAGKIRSDAKGYTVDVIPVLGAESTMKITVAVLKLDKVEFWAGSDGIKIDGGTLLLKKDAEKYGVLTGAEYTENDADTIKAIENFAYDEE